VAFLQQPRVLMAGTTMAAEVKRTGMKRMVKGTPGQALGQAPDAPKVEYVQRIILRSFRQ